VATTYRPGDIVFFSTDGVSGEAMVIGYSAEDKDALIVAIGSVFTELDVASCSPTGRSEPPPGASCRREYMKRFPKKLLGKRLQHRRPLHFTDGRRRTCNQDRRRQATRPCAH